MVREQFIKTLNETIEENPKFSYLDFSISQNRTSKRGYKTIVRIEYNYSSKYYLEIKIPDERKEFKKKSYGDEIIYLDYYINCENSPGEIELIENKNVKGVKGVENHLTIWLDLLWSELMAIPTNREIENLKKKVDELVGKINNIDGEFNEEEKEKVEKKLDELENMFIENLKSQELEKGELNKKIELLHKEIEALKKTLPILKKKNWLKSFGAKMVNWGSKPENQKMLSKTGKIIQFFIGEGVKHL